jgi:hypothetical protein
MSQIVSLSSVQSKNEECSNLPNITGKLQVKDGNDIDVIVFNYIQSNKTVLKRFLSDKDVEMPNITLEQYSKATPLRGCLQSRCIASHSP